MWGVGVPSSRAALFVAQGAAKHSIPGTYSINSVFHTCSCMLNHLVIDTIVLYRVLAAVQVETYSYRVGSYRVGGTHRTG